MAITDLPEYKSQESFWKYQIPSCKIDCIKELDVEFRKPKINLAKVALLKEMGRAAFQNPIKRSIPDSDHGDQKRAEIAARNEMTIGADEIYDILNCPVCGSKALVRFYDVDCENLIPKNESLYWIETVFIECYFCTFSLANEIRNASELGIKGIDDYWIKTTIQPDKALIRPNGLPPKA